LLLLAGQQHLAKRDVHEAVLLGRQRLLRQIAELARMAVPLHVDERENDIAPNGRVLGLTAQDALGELADAVGLGRGDTQSASEIARGFDAATGGFAQIAGQDERFRRIGIARQQRFERRESGVAQLRPLEDERFEFDERIGRRLLLEARGREQEAQLDGERQAFECLGQLAGELRMFAQRRRQELRELVLAGAGR
jgi:hypothetical protein